jgi:hypothetical protein
MVLPMLLVPVRQVPMLLVPVRQIQMLLVPVRQAPVLLFHLSFYASTNISASLR